MSRMLLRPVLYCCSSYEAMPRLDRATNVVRMLVLGDCVGCEYGGTRMYGDAGTDAVRICAAKVLAGYRRLEGAAHAGAPLRGGRRLYTRTGDLVLTVADTLADTIVGTVVDNVVDTIVGRIAYGVVASRRASYS
eukprot:754469-Rhodomonas_salina.1